MGYHYDPILCMNVPDASSKTKDASWKAWTLYIDGKWVKSFNSSMAPIKEAQKFMKENYPGKVGKLTRNTGSSSGYSISGSEYKDAAPVDVRDTKTADENYIVSGMKSQLGQMLKRYKDPKNRNQLVSQYIGIVNNHRANGKVTEEEFNEFVKYAKGLIGGSHDALDKAMRTCDVSTGHKVVVFVENYLRSIGKNNSTGKYDKIVQGVRSLLSQSLLDDEGLRKASEYEANRLLQKYNL